MVSGIAAPATGEDGIAQKRPWVEPIVVELDVGEAEAGDGSGPDSGMIS